MPWKHEHADEHLTRRAGLGLFVGSRFQEGSASLKVALVNFVHACDAHLPGCIRTIRSDSAGENHYPVNDCFHHHPRFTITADHDAAVMHTLSNIPKRAWKRGLSEDLEQVSHTLRARTL